MQKVTKFLSAGFLLVLLFSRAGLSSQITFERTYGGRSFDWGRAAVQSADEGYIIVGTTNSYGAGYGDIWLIKTDSLGDTLWTRTYGGQVDDWGEDVIPTTEGGCVAAGVKFFPDYRGYDIYLIKVDSQGETIWERTYDRHPLDWVTSMAQTMDGGYILTGGTGPFSDDSNDVYLVKADSLGDTLWTRTFGAIDSDDRGLSIVQAADGGYVIAGESGPNRLCEPGPYNVFLIKTDSLGDTLWTKHYGGIGEDVGYSITTAPDGGYVIAGMSTSYSGWYDVYLIKTDETGDTLWTRAYGGTVWSEEWGYSVICASDGGFVIAGKTDSYGHGGEDVWLIKVDDHGEVYWAKTFGGPDMDYGTSVAPADDGGYILAGVTSSYGEGICDIYLIKTDSLGKTGVKESNGTLIPRKALLSQNFPNPFNSTTQIRYYLPRDSYIKLAVYNILGQKVTTLINGKELAGDKVVLWDARGVASGIYFYRLESQAIPIEPPQSCGLKISSSVSPIYRETKKMLLMK